MLFVGLKPDAIDRFASLLRSWLIELGLSLRKIHENYSAENLNTVDVLYSSPGFRIVEGKLS